MNFLSVAVSLLLLHLTIVTYSQKLESRIVGGVPVDDDDFPFMVHILIWLIPIIGCVILHYYADFDKNYIFFSPWTTFIGLIPVSIRFRDMHQCGGTILNARHILTAAHCVDMLVNHTKLLSIQYGTAHITTNMFNVINVTNIILHVSWDINNEGYYNDIAILRLKDAIPGRYLYILELADEDEPIKDLETIQLLGWGRTESGGSGSTQLRYTEIVLFPNYYCQYFVPAYNSAFQFCGGLIKGGAGQCGGDSGGPAIINGKQFGIISWSKKPCASPGNPGIFVRIPKYRAFIDSHDDF